MGENPKISRISLEEIQEFKNLDLFNLTWEQTNGRLVILAYDPRSKEFVYNYSTPAEGGGNQNISLFYGYSDLISASLISGGSINSSARPSINGFDNGDGIIAMSTVGTVNKFDFYDVEIDVDNDIDRYVFRMSLLGEAATPVPGPPGPAGPAGPPGNTPVVSNGVNGITYKESTVFTRTSTLFEGKTVVVTGGRFSGPTPNQTTINGVPTAVVWSDGIPAGTEKVWATSFTFRSDVADANNPANIWKTPSGITDTSTTDYEYSTELINPGTPTTDPGKWSSTILNPTAIVWLAQRDIVNGIFGQWKIIKIKGETGETGSGLGIQGRDTPCNIMAKTGVADYTIWLANTAATIAEVFACSGFTLTADVSINDAFLKVPNGTGEDGSNWDSIGSVTGSDGASYKYSIVYIRSVGQPATPTGGTFALPVPNDWSDGIPTLVLPVPAGQLLWQTSRHFSDDFAANAALANWITPKIAGDTSTQEVSYAYLQAGDATPQPPNVSPGLWSDTPGETEYYWSATAVKINNVVDVTSWKVNRIRGEKGLKGDDGVNAFMASAYVKTNANIASVPVTGGTYSSPIPTSTADGKSWTDGIPAGAGAIWFTQVRISQTDTGPGKVWPAPIKIIDSSSVEYRFSASVNKPAGVPIQNDLTGINSWFDDADQVPGGVPKWMAIGSIVNNVWPTVWDIIRITGEQGAPGTDAYTYVPLTLFARCDNNAMGSTTPIGKFLTKTNNVYIADGPDPIVNVVGLNYTFTDGIPDLATTFPNNGKRIWMIQGVLNNIQNLNVGNEYIWGNPVILADSAIVDFQYKGGTSATVAGPKPANPTGLGTNPDSTGWYSNPDQVPGGAFWIAQKNWSEGPGAQWVVYQIRGEGGADASSTPLVWTYKPLYDPSNYETTTADEACSINPGTSKNILTWVSGNASVGDFFAFEPNGADRYEITFGTWVSDGISSFRLGVNGRIEEVFTCRVGGMLEPGVPGVYANNETSAHRIDIFPQPASNSSGSPIVSHQIFAHTHPFDVNAGVLIATVPHVSEVPGTKFTWSPGTGYYGPYYFTTKTLTATGTSPRSQANFIHYNRTMPMLPIGFVTKEALYSYFLSGNMSVNNSDFFVGATNIIAASSGGEGSIFYTLRTTTGIVFNGGDGWYAYKLQNQASVTAYRINSFGVVSDSSVITFPALSAWRFSAGQFTSTLAGYESLLPLYIYSSDYVIEVGTILYSNMGLTTVMAGGNLWYFDGLIGAGFIYQVNANGVVLAKVNHVPADGDPFFQP